MGLIGECIPTILIGVAANPELQKLCYSWHTVADKPCLRESNTEAKESSRAFALKFVPEQSSIAVHNYDTNFKFSFKFRVGLPANLFPTIAVRVTELSYTVQHIWEWGIFLRRAAVDLILHHNIHSSKMVLLREIEVASLTAECFSLQPWRRVP